VLSHRRDALSLHFNAVYAILRRKSDTLVFARGMNVSKTICNGDPIGVYYAPPYIALQ